MKTGKTIVRVLAVILLLSMLVGFTPAMPAASQDEGGAVVLADPVDGQDNGDTGDTGSGDTGDVPGETGGGNTDSGEGGGTTPGEGGGTTPGEGGSTEPEVKKVAVTFDGNVTVTAGDAALESGAEVEVGTELAITVKTKNVASAILVNGAKNEGTYTVAEADEKIDVSAFGISSVTVSDADKWKPSKNVVVAVFGSDVTVNGQQPDNKGVATFEQKANGTFKAVAKSGDVTVDYSVSVSKIDAVSPAVKKTDKDKNPEKVTVEKTYPVFDWDTLSFVDKTVVEETDESIYYFTVEDKGGSSIESITVQGYYSRRNHEDQKVPDKAYQISVAYEEGKADYSFQAKDSYWNYPVYYVITVVDKAGNKTEFNFDKPGSSGWADDEIGPEIHSVQSLTTRNDYVDKEIVEKNENEINPWEYNDLSKTFYVGPNSVLNVTASDRSYVRMIRLGEFEKTPPSGQYSNEFVATFSAEELKSLGTGEHSLIAYDWYTYGGNETGNSSPTNVKVNLVYDDQSPKLENVVYTMEDQSAFEKIAHAVSGGLMFHETVQVSFDLTEEGGSGIYAYYYQFAREGEDPSDWLIMPATSSQIKEKEGNVTLTLVVPDAYKTGEIVVSVFAEDNAGNVSLKDKNEADKVVLNEGKDVATHDATTVSKDGNLVVFTYTPANGDEQDPYRGEWVREVAFDVRADHTKYQEEVTKGTKPDTPADKDAVWVDAVSVSSVLKSATADASKALTNVNPHVDHSDNKNGQWTVSYGVPDNGKVATADGSVTFEVATKVEKTVTRAKVTYVDVDDGNGGTQQKSVYSWDDPVIESETNTRVIVVNGLNVQNYIDQATVPAKSHENTDNAVTFNLKNGSTYGWYNDLDRFLDDVRVVAPNSKADFTTTYSVKFLKNQSFANQAAQDKAWASVEPIAKGELTVAKDDKALFDQENIFKEEGLYLITISTKDDLDNVPAPEEESFVIKYDVKAPEITANFTETHTAEDTYYDIQRTGTITVTDLAFTGDSSEHERFTVKADPEVGSPAEKGEWKYDEANQKWSIVYTYGVRSGNAAKDGDNYKLAVDVVDNAGNKSSTTTDGILTKNGKDTDTKVYYTGDNATGFTVDQTAPVVSVSYNNNNVRNGKYFNASRTATITVVEHNFDPARVTLTATGASAGATASEGWTQNGDTWTKTVTFGRDANCKFSIDIVDKAGNVCPNANVKYSGAATADFVIDLTRPNVQYTGVDASPYAAACTPGFTATDTNLGNEFTYKLTRKTMKGEEDVSNLLNHAGSAARFSYSDIPNNRDDDGIYTLTCSVTDLAGNVTTLNPVEFAVNRHGSVYLLNDDLQGVVGKYFNEDGWNKVNDNNLVITEYNPTQLKDDAKLEIYRDGTRVASYTGEALKKLVSGGNRGSLGLYEYAYKLPADDFAEDGSYRVVLSSTDANDHKSGNDKTGAEINFVIDTVSPEIVSITGLEKRTVNAEQQPVGFHILDTYGLDSVAIRTAGPDGAIVKEYISQAKYDAQNGKLEPYQQLLPEGELDLTDEITLIQNNTPYHVVISVTDKAGNTTVADGGSIVSSTEAEAMTPSYDFQDSVTVSTNFFVRYIHNTGALVGTGVGAAALAGLWLVLAKRKKDDEEKKTA